MTCVKNLAPSEESDSAVSEAVVFVGLESEILNTDDLFDCIFLQEISLILFCLRAIDFLSISGDR